MDTISYGIIGIGHLGKIHTKIASQIDVINLVGIYDIDNQKSKETAQMYDTNAFSSLEDLLQQVQAVSIVVPTDLHFSIAKKALEYNCHLFIEKPITATAKEARELITLANARDKKIQVGHIERYNPAFLSLQDYTLNPLFIESHRLSNFNPRGTEVSVILDLMIHDIDIILNLMSSPIQSIHACGVPVVSETEDIANVRVSFSNGNVANLTASRISTKDLRKMRLFQKDTYISIDFLQQKTEIMNLKTESEMHHKHRERTSIGTIGTKEGYRHIVLEVPQIPQINSLQIELEHFIQSIQKNKAPTVTAKEGLKALEVANIILDQIKHPEA